MGAKRRNKLGDGDFMNSMLEAFYRKLKGKKVGLLGIGRSNNPLVRPFKQHGAQVFVYDKRKREELGDIATRLEADGASLILGKDYLNGLDVDILFRTPGIRYTLPELDAARAAGVAVTSEMEVFFDVCPCKIIAVTGSDGKTTTTTLITKILEHAGKHVYLGGNIGRPLLPQINEIEEDDIAVVELSSFQLISMRKSPDIAVITNISPNHLDMHKNMEEYINAKRNILLHQDGFSRTILNLDNAITEPMQDNVRGQLFGFSTKKALSYGAYVDKQGTLWMNDGKQNTRIMKENDIVIPGSHNVENYLAATAAVWGLATPEDIRAVAGSFPGVEHRIELVREVEGSRYYNDSIATTPTRTIAGLQSFKKKIILIAGGYDKKIPFDVLGPAVVKHVSNLILLGSTANKIANAVRSVKEYHEDILPIQFVSDLEEAVQLAHKLAVSGDIVLLSPACASFDMFKDFETRGEQFKELVQGL